MSFSSVDPDPEVEVAAGALARHFRERQLGRLQEWLETSASYPAAWRDAALNSEHVLWLTPAELTELSRELVEGLRERSELRRADPSARPEGAVPVEILTYAYPLNPPKEEESS